MTGQERAHAEEVGSRPYGTSCTRQNDPIGAEPPAATRLAAEANACAEVAWMSEGELSAGTIEYSAPECSNPEPGRCCSCGLSLPTAATAAIPRNRQVGGTRALRCCDPVSFRPKKYAFYERTQDVVIGGWAPG